MSPICDNCMASIRLFRKILKNLLNCASTRALSNMLTAGAIAPAVEQISSPVIGICPRSENLKFYVNYVSCNLLFVKVRSTGLVSNTM